MTWDDMVAVVRQAPAVGVLVAGLESPVPHVDAVLAEGVEVMNRYHGGGAGGGGEDRVVASGLPTLGLSSYRRKVPSLKRNYNSFCYNWRLLGLF